jgi:hypothetical protein
MVVVPLFNKHRYLVSHYSAQCGIVCDVDNYTNSEQPYDPLAFDELPDDEAQFGLPYDDLGIDTIPETIVHEGENFPDTEIPYGRIVGVTTGYYDSGLHSDVYADGVVGDITHHEVQLPEDMVDRFTVYYDAFHTDGPEARAETNCVRFACEVAGIDLTSKEPWLEAFVSLREAIHPDNEWDEHIPLPAGAVGVMGTYEFKEAVRATESSVTHACIGTGTDRVLQVAALGGYLGLRDQAEMMTHMRREIVKDGYAPEDARLFILPRRQLDPPVESGEAPLR